MKIKTILIFAFSRAKYESKENFIRKTIKRLSPWHVIAIKKGNKPVSTLGWQNYIKPQFVIDSNDVFTHVDPPSHTNVCSAYDFLGVSVAKVVVFSTNFVWKTWCAWWTVIIKKVTNVMQYVNARTRPSRRVVSSVWMQFKLI